MSTLVLVRAAGGVRRTRGLDRGEVARLLRSGDLVRPARGVVALPEADPRLVTAGALDAVVSCASAAELHGLPLLHRPTRLHLTARRGANGRQVPPGVVLHRRDVPGLDGVSTLARTAADCLRCLPEVDAVVVADGVLARGVPRVDVASELGGRGSVEPRRLLALADGRAQAPGETVARLTLLGAGIPAEPQVLVPRVGWVDLLVDGWIVIEVDGRAYHSDDASFANDRRRDVELTVNGFAVLRFPHDVVVLRPDRVVDAVQRLLVSRRSAG